MAVKTYQFTVTATAQKIATAPVGVGKVKIYFENTGATNHVFIGGDSTVTSASGYEVPNFALNTVTHRQEFELFGGESLWAVCASALTTTVAVLTVGN